jgi:hypothetical protein
MASLTDIAKRAPLIPLTVPDIDGSQLSFLFTHDMLKRGKYPLFKHEHRVDDPKVKRAFYRVYTQSGCICCAERVRAMSGLSDISGSILEFLRDCDGYTKVAKAAASLCNRGVTGVLLLQDSTVMGHVPTVGGYDHITRPVDPSDITTSTDHNRILLIKDAIEQYVMSWKFDMFVRHLVSAGDVLVKMATTSGALNRHLCRFIPSGDLLTRIASYLDDGLSSSGCAPKHNFLPAIKWCMAILDDLKLRGKAWDDFAPKEKIGFGIYHIIRADLVNGYDKISHARLFTTADSFVRGIQIKPVCYKKFQLMRLCVEQLTTRS